MITEKFVPQKFQAIQYYDLKKDILRKCVINNTMAIYQHYLITIITVLKILALHLKQAKGSDAWVSIFYSLKLHHTLIVQIKQAS